MACIAHGFISAAAAAAAAQATTAVGDRQVHPQRTKTQRERHFHIKIHVSACMFINY